MSRMLRVVAGLAVLSLTACPAGGPSTEEVKAIIGAAGGSLTHPTGAKLVIPAGALAGDVELSMKGESAPSDADVGAATAGQAFVLGPEGQQFLSPIQLTIPFDASKIPVGSTASSLAIRISPQSPLSFTELPTTVDEASHLLSADITHFSIVVPAVGGGSSCTSLSNDAPLVAETKVADVAPQAQGGAVTSGTYYRTSTVIYTGAGGSNGLTGKTRKQTLKLTMSGNSGTVENVDDNQSGSITRDSGNVTLSGSSFTLSRVCPSPATQTISYTATASTFAVIETVSEGTRVTTFTLSSQVDAGTQGSCSTLTQVGPLVNETMLNQTAPTPTGGTVSSGTYVRTADLIYTGSSGGTGNTGKQRRHTLQVDVAAGTSNEIYNNVSAGDPTQLRAYSFTSNGNSLTFSLTCPATSGSVTMPYSATSSELRMFETVSQGTLVQVYTMLYADGGVPPAYDAGTVVTDGGQGQPDAGPAIETLGTGLTDLVDVDVGATDVFVLGGGTVKKCAFSGCGTSATTVANVYASSLAVNGNTLFVTDSFRYVSSCDFSGGSCALSQFTDVGANTYPTHLWIANSHLYWMSESGSTRLIQTCPLTGCTTGYPKTVFNGSLLDGVALGGLVVDAQNAYVLSFTGGIFKIPLTDVETGNATTAANLVGTEYGSGGLDLDSALIRFTVIGANKVMACTTPDCGALGQVKNGFVSPASVRSNATHVYGIDRGTPNGSGGYVAGTATIWRYTK